MDIKTSIQIEIKADIHPDIKISAQIDIRTSRHQGIHPHRLTDIKVYIKILRNPDR